MSYVNAMHLEFHRQEFPEMWNGGIYVIGILLTPPQSNIGYFGGG